MTLPNKLMSCPFCGELPDLQEKQVKVSREKKVLMRGGKTRTIKDFGYEPRAYIQCCFGDFHANPCGYDGTPEPELSPDEVIAAWNTCHNPYKDTLQGENILHKGGIIEHWCNNPDCAACHNPSKTTDPEATS